MPLAQPRGSSVSRPPATAPGVVGGRSLTILLTGTPSMANTVVDDYVEVPVASSEEETP